MAKCKVCSKGGKKFKVLQRPTAGVCGACIPEEISPAEDACVCPPIGEPDKLTVLTPVVFDECGVNICKTIEDLVDLLECKHDTEDKLTIITDDPIDFDDVDAIDLQVLDINFHIKEGTVRTLDRRPNCVRVRLENIKITFLVRFLDDDCEVLGEAILESFFLPDDEEDPQFDDETNRPFAIDLYAPYGVHRKVGSFKDDIQFIGFLCDNNQLKQGIVAQALAKVVAFDPDEVAVSIGVTLYLKVVYFVQYRIPHCGLCVPPKCIEVEEALENACIEFVEGNLLEQSIQPLEVCCPSQTVPKGFIPVVDPTPSQECPKNHKHC